jgi:hypothetical protein
MTARPNAFSGQFDVASRARRSRAVAESVERQSSRIEAKVRPPVSCLREGRRQNPTASPEASGRDQ